MTTPDFAIQGVASEVSGSVTAARSNRRLRYVSSLPGKLAGDAAAIFSAVYLVCNWTGAHSVGTAHASRFAVAGIVAAAAGIFAFCGFGVYNPDSSPLKIATTQRLIRSVTSLWMLAFLGCLLFNGELIHIVAAAAIFASLLVATQRGVRAELLRMAGRGSRVAQDPMAAGSASHSEARQNPGHVSRRSRSSAADLHGRGRSAQGVPYVVTLHRTGTPPLTGDRRTATAIKPRHTQHRPVILLAGRRPAARSLRYRPSALASDTLRRGIDILGASVMVLTLAPLLAVAAALVKLDSRGPIFFRHARVGKDGRNFELWKFRSMRVAAHPYQKSPSSDRDPRLTPIGRVLRRTSIDELPQLLNVLRGDMSLVGPRPEMPFLANQHNPLVRQRIQVKPGMTGLWQIGPARAFPIHENIEYDLFYADHQSLSLDCAILLRTLTAVVRGVGAA